MTLFSIDKRELKFASGSTVTFPLVIAQTISNENWLFVRLLVEPDQECNENIFCYENSGRLMWQIGEIPRVRPHSPYTGMELRDGVLIGYAWCGATGKFDLRTGKAIESWHSRM